MSRFADILAVAQGLYFALTGLWPLVHMPSFIAVTGPKTDLWLVRTVGVLVLAIGVVLGVAGLRSHMNLEVCLLAILSAAGLTAIDVIYVARQVISKIYLLDALAETVLLICWAVLLAHWLMSM